MRRSAGIMAFQQHNAAVDVLLVHPGGPFWARRDAGAWSIPKGEYDSEELPEAAARREFAEEIGVSYAGPLIGLGEVRQNSGKIVTAYAAPADFDVARLHSNLFEMEWPPKSGRRQTFPEIDRAEWFSLDEARRRILPAQEIFLDRLLTQLDVTAR